MPEKRGTEEYCVFSGSVGLIEVGLTGDGQDLSVGLGCHWNHVDLHRERPGHPGTALQDGTLVGGFRCPCNEFK